MATAEDDSVAQVSLSAKGLVPLDQIPSETISPPLHLSVDVVWSVVEKMIAICRANDGMGLSAVQIGIPWKLFVCQKIRLGIPDDNFRCFADCEYEPLSDQKVEVLEGCLSIPGERFLVPRWTHVLITGKEIVRNSVFGIKDVAFESRIDYNVDAGMLLNHVVWQHEIEHHHGILINQKGVRYAIR